MSAAAHQRSAPADLTEAWPRPAGLPRVVEAARFIARTGWVVVLVVAPVALLTHSGAALVLTVVLAALWQLLALLLTSAARHRTSPTRARLRFRQVANLWQELRLCSPHLA